jgi:hypothetical protein
VSSLDSLLERGRQPGAFVERRRFTLSREKAIAKIREFSLRHPEQYILELVQSAVFAGADHIAIETRPEHMLIAFIGGRPLTLDQLEGLFDYLFADRADPATRHLVQLAIGVNAILQRKPRRLRIESGDGTVAGSVRLDLDAQGKGTIGRPTAGLRGTYLWVEHPGAWLSRFAGTKLTSEQALIEERCMYTPVPILVNTEAPFGYRACRQISLFGVPDEEAFDTGSRRGVLAVSAPNAVRPGVRLVVAGVWVNTHPMPLLGTAPPRSPSHPDRLLMGVICDDELRKTADQSDIVQERSWHEMLHCVQPYATRLLRRTVGSKYAPPALPPLPQERPSESAGGIQGPAPEPLGHEVRRAGKLGGVPVRDLKTLHPETPVFWLQPDAEAEIGNTGDPCRFPHLVLILRPGQAVTLHNVAPALALHRLTTAADVEFVRGAMTRRLRQVEVSLSLEQGPCQGELCLKLQLAGDRPTWALADPEEVPICVARDGQTLAIHALWLDLPGVSAVLHLSGPEAELPDPEVLAARLDHEAWRLLEAVSNWASEPAVQPLCLALLGRHARQFLVRRGTELSCEAALPPSWGAVGASLLQAPVFQTRTGPRSLADLVVFGTVHEPRPGMVRRSLETLELRFFPGRVAWPDLQEDLIAGVGLLGERWVGLSPGDLKRPALRAVVALSATRSAHPPKDWKSLASAGPTLLALTRDDDPVPWDEGYRTLFTNLLGWELSDNWEDSLGSRVSRNRAKTLGREALMSLAVQLGTSATAPLICGTQGDVRRSLVDWQNRPGFRISARAGAQVSEPDTVALSPEQLIILEQAHGPLPLRFDDPPQLWEDLADPNRDGWLLRQEVVLDGVRGWLGLRHPHDPTSAILVEAGNHLQALPELAAEIPCHGLLRFDQMDGLLTSVQLSMLRLSAIQLYQRLSTMTEASDPERRQSAWRYGTEFVLAAWSRSGGQSLTGAAARLARTLEIPGAKGGVWGSLEHWLRVPAAHRPALPAGLVLPALARSVPALPSEESHPLAAAQDKLESVLEELGSPIQILVMSESRRSRDLVRLNASSTHANLAVLWLNVRHPLHAKALSHPTGREILLLEMAREVCNLADSQGRFIDLKLLQRALLARRPQQ